METDSEMQPLMVVGLFICVGLFFLVGLVFLYVANEDAPLPKCINRNWALMFMGIFILGLSCITVTQGGTSRKCRAYRRPRRRA